MRPSNLFSAAILFSATAVADGENIIDFNRDIRPIHADRCFKCHGPDEKKREAKLRLDVLSGATKDLGGHSAVETGKPDRSEYYCRVSTSKDNELRMPPEGSRYDILALPGRLLQLLRFTVLNDIIYRHEPT